MRLSYNWLKELVDFSFSPEELDYILTMLGIEVEAIIDYGKLYNGFEVAKVLEASKHPDADKLSICKVESGDGIKHIVCGAPNVASNQYVVLGHIGATVPKGGFKLEKRKIRGEISEGMICSKVELDLGEDDGGIWVLGIGSDGEFTHSIGTPLADYLSMNDVVFEISITPNRADCLSHFGIAREIAAYSGKKFTEPIFELNESDNNTDDYVRITIEDEAKCPRYTARIINNLTVAESPLWLQNKLIMLAMRPINAIVDVTNYVMLECGQPLHAFDYDKISGKHVIIKTAALGEKFETLDGKIRDLDSDMLMICDESESIAIGGVMGGANSEITDSTTNILIESAYFNPSSVRRTAKKLGISSESSYRFERGVDPERVGYASYRAAYLINQIAGGKVSKGILDAYPSVLVKPEIKFRFNRASDIIGDKIENAQMVHIITSLGFEVIEENEDYLILIPPSYRVDMSGEIDVIEEIARLVNYDNIKADFSSSIDFSATGIIESLSVPPIYDRIRSYLVPIGINEILTQNQIDPKSALLFSGTLVDNDRLIRLSNPLGEDLSVMRPSLVPSMLRTVDRNSKYGNKDLALFEIGRTFTSAQKSEGIVAGVKESEELIICLTGKSMPLQWSSAARMVDFYDIKGVIEQLFRDFKIDNTQFIPTTMNSIIFNPNSMTVEINGLKCASFGEVKKELLKQFDIEFPVFIALIEVDKLDRLTRGTKYELVPPYPGSTRDLAFLVDDKVNSGDIADVISKAGGENLKSVIVFDVYKGKNIEAGLKSMAYSLYFAANDRTMTDTEIEMSINKIESAVKDAFAAELRKF